MRDSVRRATRPVGTYSIVARDHEALGVAVQSHWYNVGAVVPWVDAAVGAVAVQSFSGPEAGYRGLQALRTGTPPAMILHDLLDDDVQRSGGQIAIVGIDGAVATHTGLGCIPCSGHQTGPGYSVQANLMDNDRVWPAMATAFERADGDLAERLLAALEAAEVAGGDVRGRQSAAIVVASPGQPAPLDRTFDLRVEDHPDPVSELRRLVRLRRAYRQLNDGDQLLARHDVAGALAAYEAATKTAGDGAADGEPEFWTGIALAGCDRIADAERYLRRAAALSDRWARLVPRLVAPGMLADDPELVATLVRAATPQ